MASPAIAPNGTATGMGLLASLTGGGRQPFGVERTRAKSPPIGLQGGLSLSSVTPASRPACRT